MLLCSPPQIDHNPLQVRVLPLLPILLIQVTLMKTYSFENTLDNQKFVIDRLSHNGHLSQWEKDFIKSIKEYTDNAGFLSEKQLQKLSDLWEKY